MKGAAEAKGEQEVKQGFRKGKASAIRSTVCGTLFR